MDEQNDTIDRQQKLMNLKLKIALDLPIDDEPLSEDQISVAHAKIFNPEASSDFFGI